MAENCILNGVGWLFGLKEVDREVELGAGSGSAEVLKCWNAMRCCWMMV